MAKTNQNQNYNHYNQDIQLSLLDNSVNVAQHSKLDWNIVLSDTGLNTLTGGRLLKLSKYLKNENFFMTYGDGLCSINLDSLIQFHLKHKKIASVTAVHPPVRFGELEIKGDDVTKFEEKPQASAGWINGGYFVLNSKVFDYIDNDQTLFEKEPMTSLCNDNNLKAFKHENFWKCMDTIRDKIDLEKILSTQGPIWKK